MSGQTTGVCKGCGWHRFCGENHYHRRMRLSGCTELDHYYQFKFGNTLDGFVCPRGGIGGPGLFSIFRRERGEKEWEWVGYV